MRRMTLREIADEASLSMADVAFLAQLPQSTLSRLWDDEEWLDRITGHSLKQLISALPGLVAQLSSQSCGPRLLGAVRDCTELGLQVSMERVNALFAAGCAVQRVTSALETAVAVMSLNEHDAASYLTRCWGAGQDVALDALLAPAASPKALLSDNTPLLAKASQLLDRFKYSQRGSLHTVVGHGILVHKLTKLTGEGQASISPKTKRGEAFAHRSAVIGLLLGFADLDAAQAYQRSVEQSPLLRVNEIWSLATYARDVARTLDFTLPQKSTLTKTAAEIVRDVAELNEVYLYYVASTAVPTLLGHDPTFGSQGARLTDALTARLERGVAPAVDRACAVLIKSLADS